MTCLLNTQCDHPCDLDAPACVCKALREYFQTTDAPRAIFLAAHPEEPDYDAAITTLNDLLASHEATSYHGHCISDVRDLIAELKHDQDLHMNDWLAHHGFAGALQ